MKIQRRSDYKAPTHTITHVKLDIDLDPLQTRVTSILSVECVGSSDTPLFLHGEDLNLIELQIDNQDWVEHVEHVDGGMLISKLPTACEIRIVNTISPQNNKTLNGMYRAEQTYCTQCEAEGFRRITYYMDRPDVLAVFTVILRAPANQYPHLLSNGNKIAEIIDTHGMRVTTWHDPFPKPSYLFAVVAGDFDCISKPFVTASGKQVALEIYVDKGFSERANFALESLIRAMRWDEEVYGLEYDLDVYMIVAVDFFNMGAMENKGLNVFNSKFILADAKTATDDDFFNVESVVAHEYFHNWTGNRVTCRDWFQLSLKEGLTVFRDQQFSADMSTELSTRLGQVKVMREHQFAEDASAMSHPIRPDEVIEMNNFYTVTVYDKGAEVIRMLHSILGNEAFKQGMDAYFKQHDGKAVTCDDFVAAMQTATKFDLTHFKRWYSQSGTPRVTVEERLSDTGEFLIVDVKQHTPITADQSEKQALSIVLRYHCYTENGTSLELHKTQGNIHCLSNNLLLLEGSEAKLYFATAKNGHVQAMPTLTLQANFSAPIIINQEYSIDRLETVAQFDPDPFNRWDALQSLYRHCIEELEQGNHGSVSRIVLLLENVIVQFKNQPRLLSELLTVPSVESLSQQRQNLDPLLLAKARQDFCTKIASALYHEFEALLPDVKKSEYQYQQDDVEDRHLRKTLLALMSFCAQSGALIEQVYHQSNNMTDTLSALKAAQNHKDLFHALMTDFENIWRKDGLVMDKWFALHATSQNKDIVSTISLLTDHPIFNSENPNRVRSLIGSFAFYNSVGFHAVNGSGYKYVTDYLMKLDKLNPQVAARIVTPLTQWQKYTQKHQMLMKAQLSRLLTHSGLSKDVFEKVSKSLAYEQKQA